MIEKSLEFLKLYCPQGPWVLTGIQVDRKGIETITFSSGEEEQMLSWVSKISGKKNIYFHVNTPLRNLTKKAEKTDIKEVTHFHVDIDPRAGEDFNSERERALGLLTNSKTPPTFIIDSGGGYQGFWRLNEPIEINGDLKLAQDAERFNVQLENEYGADHCHNVDRIMRLPGTINIPDAKKKKKGRKEASTSMVVFNEGNVYSVSSFAQAPKVQSEDVGFSGETVVIDGDIERLDSVDDLDKWEVPDWLKVLIVQGNDPDNPGRWPSRSEVYFAVSCELVRRGVDDQVVFSILTDPSFNVSEAILEKRSPEKYALRQIERAHENAIDPMLRELNEKHAVIGDIGGRCRIISEVYDAALKRTRISKQSFDDFRNRYRNKKVTVGTSEDGRPITKQAGAWWIDHPNRRQFETIIFAPGQEVPEAYNLWKGFACEALPGDQHLGLLNHIKKNVCKGEERLYNYLMAWMARTVQHLDTPGEVAIILRGGRGAGKSFMIKAFGHLFGRHFLQVADSKHLVGSFNAHLRDTVVLFGDEAFYAGDKRHESVLKMLITEETLMVEGKGVDAEASPNYTHLMMASNASWVAPAGPDERRYLVIDVGEGVKQDSRYFADLKKQLENGGYENLLHYLMMYDLTDFEVRTVPQTEALQDQKLLSLSPEEQWWYEKLYYGRLTNDHSSWEQEIQVRELQADYIEFMRHLGVARKSSNIALGKFLTQVAPRDSIKNYQRRAEVLTYTPEGYLVKKMGRPYFYMLPTLEVLRTTWDTCYGGPYPWKEIPEHDETEENKTKEPF